MEPTPDERAERLHGRLLQALRGTMAERGIKRFADQLGLGHATLLHKLEPDNASDELTLRQLLRLLVRLDAGAVMRPVAAELGGQWLTIPDAQSVGADVHRLMTEAGKEFGDVAAALLAGADPNGPGGADWTDEECDRLEREGDEANAKLREIIAAARRRRVVYLDDARRG